MLRTAFTLASPAGTRARLSILIFHRVLAQRDDLVPDEIDAARFDAICAWLASWFNVLPLDVAVGRLRDGNLPARALAISFDDGYADNHDIALPILKRHGLCATFFIATGFVDGGRMWNDSVIEAVRAARGPGLDLANIGVQGINHVAVATVDEKRLAIATLLPALKYLETARREEAAAEVARAVGVALPNDLMMSSAQLRTLRRSGMQVGAHTVNHPILRDLPTAMATDEIRSSKSALEALLNEPVSMFAYPNGKPGVDYGSETVNIVRRCGFDAAVTTGWGAVRRDTDALQLPRFTPWDRSRLRFGLRLLRNLQSSGDPAAC
jgi:peptidoglycan/xylan/chitin deacetylase (PgdA/CDA1 family)